MKFLNHTIAIIAVILLTGCSLTRYVPEGERLLTKNTVKIHRQKGISGKTYEAQEISKYIIESLHHGVTVSTVTGEYTQDEKTMIHTVCKRIEAIKLRNQIKEIDPGAFIIITTSSEIIGRGFRSV